jgi:hypothetical protein
MSVEGEGHRSRSRSRDRERSRSRDQFDGQDTGASDGHNQLPVAGNQQEADNNPAENKGNNLYVTNLFFKVRPLLASADYI